MRTEEEIKQKLAQIQKNKASARYKGSDHAYVTNLKIEKVLKWILEEGE